MMADEEIPQGSDSLGHAEEEETLQSSEEKDNETVVTGSVEGSHVSTHEDAKKVIAETASEYNLQELNDGDKNIDENEAIDDPYKTADSSNPSVSLVQFPQLESSVVNSEDRPDLLSNVDVDLTVELGRKDMTVGEISSVGIHDVIELSKQAGEAFEVRINGSLFAVGDVVIIGQNMAVRITQMIDKDFSNS